MQRKSGDTRLEIAVKGLGWRRVGRKAFIRRVQATKGKTRQWGHRASNSLLLTLSFWLLMQTVWFAAWSHLLLADLSAPGQFRTRRHRLPGGSCNPPTGWHCNVRT